MFFSSNWATNNYTKLFCFFEAFFQKLTKTCHLGLKKFFSHQIVPYTATLSFSVLLKHSTQIEKKLSFCQKVFISSKWALYGYSSFFCCFEIFLQKLTKQLSFMSKKVFFKTNWSIYLCFSLHNEQNTAKWSLFVVLKHFYKNWQKTYHLCQKSVYLIKLSHIQLL